MTRISNRVFHQIFKVCLGVKKNEKVLILTDKKMLSVGKMLFEASRKYSGISILMIKPVGKRSAENPSKDVSDAMKKADVVIAPTYHSITHTKAAREARRAGVRVATMPRILMRSFVNGAMSADYSQVYKLTMRMNRVLRGSKRVHVRAPNGTYFNFSSIGRKWMPDSGKFEMKGDVGNLPAGEVFIAPVERSVNGIIAFDYFPLASGKVELFVKNGKVKQVRGRAGKLLRAFKEFGSKCRQVAEVGIGTNPKAKIVRNVLEDEKVKGTVHVALGNNVGFGGKNDVQFHQDGIIEKPTVEVDGRIIIKNGKWLV